MKTKNNFKVLLTLWAFFTAGSAFALDLAYLRNNSLFMMPAIDQGNSSEVRIQSGVSRFAVDGGNLAYLKGNSLYLLVNAAANPQGNADRIASGVGDFDLEGDLLVYLDNSRLWIQRISKIGNGLATRVESSVSSFKLEDGHVVFLKNPSALYRVTDVDTGASEKIESSVSDYSIGN